MHKRFYQTLKLEGTFEITSPALTLQIKTKVQRHYVTCSMSQSCTGKGFLFCFKKEKKNKAVFTVTVSLRFPILCFPSTVL